MGVWDIEVLGDHSYALYGFLSHNCSAPNLQQVPRESYIRDCFTAADGHELVVMDVKNMEMGVACSEPIANEMLMQTALRESVDLHTLTGHLIFHIPIEQVEKEQRQRAKSCNFGLLFGSGAPGLKDYFASFGTSITLDEAIEFRKAWLAAYPAMAAWHRKAKWEVERSGEVRMVDGRRRWLVGEQAKPTVWLNNLVQGTAASIVKRTMVGVLPKLPKGARLVAQIHDELIVEAPEGAGEEVLALMQAQLLAAGREIIGDSVDMLGEGSVARSWGKAK
jgi:DNA polymerase-1